MELGNKPSFMGVYTGGIVVPALPTVLPKLCVYAWVVSPIESPEGQIQRPGVWRITREVLDADRAYLSDCLQHLTWRQMADVAEDHNTGDVIVTFRGEHPADSEATPALPTEQWRSD